MKQSDLMRWGSYVGALGGILLIIGAIIHPTTETPQIVMSNRWILAHLILGKGLLLSLIGLVVIYLKMAEKSGKVGLIGFLLAFAGLAGFMFIVYSASVIEPVVLKYAPQLGDPNGPLLNGPLGIFFIGSLICYALGFSLFGLSVWQTNKTRWLGAAIIIGSFPYFYYLIKPETPELLSNICIVILSVGLWGLYRQVWSESK